MSWITLTESDVLAELTPAEQAALAAIQGATDQLPDLITKCVAQARGAIRAGGYALGDDGTVPDQIATDVVAMARWHWLISFPQLARLQTKDRAEASKDGRQVLKEIAAQKYKVEPPMPDSGTAPASQPASGSWNSENKLIMRTHPVPPPATQFQTTSDNTQAPYANPAAPADSDGSS